MEWNSLLIVFGSILLAELGDKTQVATLLFATQRGKLEVFIASSVALVISSAVAVLVGTALEQFLPLRIVRIVAGGGFVLLGGLMLWGARGV